MSMVVKLGLDGFSMQKLAKAAGVSPATIYIYWKDKDDLLLSLYADASAVMADTTLKGFDPRASFQEGLKVQWINRARWCLDHPVEAAFLEQMKYSSLHDRAHAATGTRFSEVMRDFVKGAVARGEIVKMPVEVFWSVAFAPLYQLVKFHWHGRSLPGRGPFALDDKILNLTLERVLKALQP